VGLINDGGAEGTEAFGLHYPLSASNVTRLHWDVRVRRMALHSVMPRGGPIAGATTVTLQGTGFQPPMTCVFRRDSIPTTVAAAVVSEAEATCVTPRGSSRVSPRVSYSYSFTRFETIVTIAILGAYPRKTWRASTLRLIVSLAMNTDFVFTHVTWPCSKVAAELTFADGCFLPFDFQYYAAPEVLVIRPIAGPRFGAVNITVFATNLRFLHEYAPYMALRCSLGQQGTAEVGAAVAVLQGYLSHDKTYVVCPTSAANMVEGRHIVRLSFNAQQYTAPAAVPALDTVSFYAKVVPTRYCPPRHPTHFEHLVC